MNRILFINGYAFHKKYNFPKLLADWNVDASLVMCCSSKFGLDVTVNREGYERVFMFDSFESNPDVERVAWSVCEAGVSAVAAANEDDLLLAGRLRRSFGLPDAEPDFGMAYRDKVVMKNLARDNGFAVPNYAAVDSPIDAYEFVREYGYPVVVKPRRKAGTSGVRMVRDGAALELALHDAFSSVHRDDGHRIMIESAVEGALYSINGMVLEDGEIVSWPTVLDGSWIGMVDDSDIILDQVLTPFDPMTPKLRQYAERLVTAYGLRNSVFHIEVFAKPGASEIVLCEIAARSPGMLLAQCWAKAFGINLHELSFVVQASAGKNERVRQEFERLKNWKWDGTVVGYVSIPLQSGIILRPQPPEIEGVEFVRIAQDGTQYNRASEITALAVQALIEGRDLAELQSRAKQVTEWYNSAVTYDSHERMAKSFI